MSDAQHAPRRRSSEEIERLTCPKCGNFMEVIPLVRGPGHFANRVSNAAVRRNPSRAEVTPASAFTVPDCKDTPRAIVLI
jgi:hypothetical protein